MHLVLNNKIQVSIKALYLQQDRVFDNFQTLSVKNSLRYVMDINGNALAFTAQRAAANMNLL